MATKVLMETKFQWQQYSNGNKVQMATKVPMAAKVPMATNVQLATKVTMVTKVTMAATQRSLADLASNGI